MFFERDNVSLSAKYKLLIESYIWSITGRYENYLFPKYTGEEKKISFGLIYIYPFNVRIFCFEKCLFVSYLCNECQPKSSHRNISAIQDISYFCLYTKILFVYKKSFLRKQRIRISSCLKFSLNFLQKPKI